MKKLRERAMSAEDAAILEKASKILQRSAKRHSEELTDPRKARRLLSMHLYGKASEEFVCAWLDTRHRLISMESVFFGTIDGATVHPREIVKRGLELNARP